MRTRVAGIIKIGEGYALMHRKDVKKNGYLPEYYVFAGGGIEEGETLEEGVVREIKEEFGITVKPKKILYENEFKLNNQKEYYFLCEYVSGKFGTGDGPEFNNDPKYINSGKFIPEIVKLEKLKRITLLPQNIAKQFIEDIEKGII